MSVIVNMNYLGAVVYAPVTPGVILAGMPMGLLMLITYAVNGG